MKSPLDVPPPLEPIESPEPVEFKWVPSSDPKDLTWEDNSEESPDPTDRNKYREFLRSEGDNFKKGKIDALINHYTLSRLPEYNSFGESKKRMREWVLSTLRFNPDFVTRVRLGMIDPNIETRGFRAALRQDLSSSSSQTGRGASRDEHRPVTNAYDRKQQKKKATARKSWTSKYT